jgi:hypothetical protein
MLRTVPLIDGLAISERDVADFFGSLSSDEMILREDDAWTAAEQLQHLNIAVAAVARGFNLPAWLLRLRFGHARRPSRPFQEMRADYLARLALGAGATGRYVPTLADLEGEDPIVQRTMLLSRWHRASEWLRYGLHGWSDANLDSVLLPHPILGRITAREMIHFTIYHNGHHIAAAKRRLPRFRGKSDRAG